MDRHYWILQANPDVYRVFDALEARAVRTWTVARYQHWIAPGDDVAIWASGPDSGIYAFGVVTEAPGLRAVDPAYWVSPPGGDAWQIRIRVTGIPEEPILRSEIAAALATAPIIRAPGEANPFPVTEAQWQAICSRITQLRSDMNNESQAGPGGDELAIPAWRSEYKVMDAVTWGEKSVAFAMTSWHERLYLAWTGTDTNLNLAWSPDARFILGKLRLDQQSYTTRGGGPEGGSRRYPVAPALAASGEHLYLAWMGADQPLAGLRGWFSDVDYINILTGPESPRGAPVRVEEARSRVPPALCSHRGSLILAWTGTDHHINILTDPERSHGAPGWLEEASSRVAPALRSHRGSLVLAWTGTDHHINILTDPERSHAAPVRLEKASSQDMPALCSHQGRLVLAWSGTDHNLNLARLQ